MRSGEVKEREQVRRPQTGLPSTSRGVHLTKLLVREMRTSGSNPKWTLLMGTWVRHTRGRQQSLPPPKAQLIL